MGQVGPMDKCPDYQGAVISGVWMCVHLYKWDHGQGQQVILKRQLKIHHDPSGNW